MNIIFPDPASQGQPDGFSSLDCVDIILDDDNADTTVRPLRPELVPFALAEREKLARWPGPREEVDIIVAGDGDTTVRPLRPELMPFALAEREKRARWQAFLDQQSSPTSGADKTDSKDGPREG
jgi:hypothetical protein